MAASATLGERRVRYQNGRSQENCTAWGKTLHCATLPPSIRPFQGQRTNMFHKSPFFRRLDAPCPFGKDVRSWSRLGVFRFLRRIGWTLEGEGIAIRVRDVRYPHPFADKGTFGLYSARFELMVDSECISACKGMPTPTLLVGKLAWRPSFQNSCSMMAAEASSSLHQRILPSGIHFITISKPRPST